MAEREIILRVFWLSLGPIFCVFKYVLFIGPKIDQESLHSSSHHDWWLVSLL